MKKLAVVLALSLPFALGACSQSVESVSPAAATSSSPAAKPSEVKNTLLAEFGFATKYKNGVSVTVGLPTKFKPANTSAGHEIGNDAYAVSVTVANGSDEALSLGMMNVNASAGETEAEKVFDSASGLMGTPSTKVLPGKSKTFKTGFSVPKGSVIDQIEASPSYEYKASIFTPAA